MLSRFHLIPERYGQTDGRTDGRTDRFTMSITYVSMLTRDKNVLHMKESNFNTVVQYTLKFPISVNNVGNFFTSI